MAGTIVKLLDCKGTTSGANATQEQFVMLFTFMEAMVTAGHCTRIALQWGNGGTGTDFWDGANPFGENAFAVYTWGAGAGTARDVLIQWAAADDFGIAPGNPGTLNGVAAADGVGIAMATREDGASPWAGTTNNDGNDIKGTPVWTPAGSAVHVIEQTNSVGSHATNKENCYRTALAAPNAMRMHIVGDADNIAILSSETDNGEYRCFTMGRYVPRVGFSGPNPLYAISEMGFPMWAVATYGTSTGIGTRQSGILGRSGADGVAFVRVGEVLFSGFLTTTYQPNQQVVPQQLDGVTPLLVFGSPVRYGLCGSPDGEVLAVFFTDTYEALDPTGSRAYMGDTGGSDHRWGIPWDGGPAPGVGIARTGRLS
jgi:hypothetical protein